MYHWERTSHTQFIKRLKLDASKRKLYQVFIILLFLKVKLSYNLEIILNEIWYLEILL